MLSILARRGASLKPSSPKESPPSFLAQPVWAHLPHTWPALTHSCRARLSTSPPLKSTSLTNAASRFPPRPCRGNLFLRPYTTTTMLKQAVQMHDAIASTSQPNSACKQSSLGNAFNRTGSTQTSARPLANEVKQNIAGSQRPSASSTQGVKRTSNGLAKSLGPHEDDFDYPTLNIADMDKENTIPEDFYASGTHSAFLETALYDEDDFDSDVDLDVEDPATKGTVTYPTLPHVASARSGDSGYDSRSQTADTKPESDSSQPIPWSSSPLEHLKIPNNPEPLRVKRRTLPWDYSQKAPPVQEEDDVDEIAPAKKRQTTAAEKTVATPAPKESSSQYLWNTTASALKQQQKAFKENMKAQAKSNQGTDEDGKEAIAKKKKKNTIARIFLSEEQQNVLNLVVEYKKSVFFTGSAGMWDGAPFPRRTC